MESEDKKLRISRSLNPGRSVWHRPGRDQELACNAAELGEKRLQLEECIPNPRHLTRFIHNIISNTRILSITSPSKRKLKCKLSRY